jgi:uncharacterized protein (TIGR03067 family)
MRAIRWLTVAVMTGLLLAGARTGTAGEPASAETAQQDQAVRRWVARLADADWFERHRAAQKLGDLGPAAKPAVPALAAALKDPERWVRASAAEALGKIGPASRTAVPGLLTATRDPESLVRAAAGKALAGIGPADPETIRLLIAACDDRNELVRVAAAAALEADLIGTDALPGLLTAVEDPDPAVQVVAAGALRRVAPLHKEAVLILLADSKDLHKHPQTAATTVLQTGAFDADVVPALIGALDDKQPAVRRLAARALGRVGPPAKEAVPALCGSLKDAEAPVRQAAVAALVRLGPAAQAAVPALILALKDADPEVRGLAGTALKSVGPPAKEALPDLIADLKDKDRTVQLAGVRALGQMGPTAREAVPALVAVLTDRTADLALRVTAAGSLGAMGAAAKEAGSDLLAALNDPDLILREAARDALKEIGIPVEPAADLRSSSSTAMIQGTWRVVSRDTGGKQTTFEAGIGEVTVVCSGAEVKIYLEQAADAEPWITGTFKLDAGKKLKEIDLQLASPFGRGHERSAHGIYELQEDTLRICLPLQSTAERPKAFTADGESKQVVVVLRRVKP